MCGGDDYGGTDEYRALVGAVPNGILALFDADLRYRIVGPATLPISGAEASTKVGRCVDELYPDAVAAQLRPLFEATLDGEPQSHEVVHLDRVHRVETAPAASDGESYGVVLTQDVTAERHRSDELTRRREELEMFASVVSHDLRNPLSIAKGYLDHARTAEGDDAAEALVRVAGALHRMEAIIDDLLRATADDEGVRRRDRVAIATVATEAWGMVDTGTATLVIETDLVVDGDESRLGRLFENAFGNAIEHGVSGEARGAGLTVTVTDHPGGFAIEDDGTGIDPEHRDAAVRAGYTTRDKGTGFGLYIIRDVALAHGWEMQLSEGTAGGLRLEFVIDRHETSTGSPPARRA